MINLPKTKLVVIISLELNLPFNENAGFTVAYLKNEIGLPELQINPFVFSV